MSRSCGHRHQYRRGPARRRDTLATKLKHMVKSACRCKAAAVRTVLHAYGSMHHLFKAGSGKALMRMLSCMHNSGLRRKLGLLRLHQLCSLTATETSVGHDTESSRAAAADKPGADKRAAATAGNLVQATPNEAAKAAAANTLRAPVLANGTGATATESATQSTTLPRIRKLHRWLQTAQAAALYPQQQAASTAVLGDSQIAVKTAVQPQQQRHAVEPVDALPQLPHAPVTVVTVASSRQPSALMAALHGGSQMAAVRHLLKKPPSDDVLLAQTRRGHSTQPVRMRDMRKLLQQDGWLNDEVVNFYMQLLQKRDDEQCVAKSDHSAMKPPRVYIFNSFFWTQLTSPVGRTAAAASMQQGKQAAVRSARQRCKAQGQAYSAATAASAAGLGSMSGLRGQGSNHYQYSNVQRWTRPNKTHTPDCILCRDLILVPINITQSHWCLAAIWPHRRLIQLYDSLACCHTRATRMMHTLARWYCDDVADKAPWAPAARCPHSHGSTQTTSSVEAATGLQKHGLKTTGGTEFGNGILKRGPTSAGRTMPVNGVQKFSRSLEGAGDASQPHQLLAQQRHMQQQQRMQQEHHQRCEMTKHVNTDNSAEAAGTSGVLEASMFTCEVVFGIPGQRDGSACGVFMCTFAELLSRGVQPPFDYSQSDMASIRMGMASEIMARHIYP